MRDCVVKNALETIHFRDAPTDSGMWQEFVRRPSAGVPTSGGIFDSGTASRRHSNKLKDDGVSEQTPTARVRIRKELFGHISLLAPDFRLGA
jgi:hypothetical protein